MAAHKTNGKMKRILMETDDGIVYEFDATYLTSIVIHNNGHDGSASIEMYLYAPGGLESHRINEPAQLPEGTRLIEHGPPQA